ncbi:MAG: hypothetical protein QOF77_2127 [Solirubrobacteraceae bacterium]|nr:hypothetical protein [Solirubrobacteraceae bacterium]
MIERAAVLAEGSGSETVLQWLLDHGAQPEAIVPTTERHGIHGADRRASSAAASPSPSRYILPAGALD